MNRCQICIMPSIPGVIALDEDGVCQQCRDYRPFPLKGEEALLALLNAHRKPGRGPDVIVTVSGGRDSAFTLLKVVRDYGVRALAVNYENPFADDQARANIENMTDILQVPLIQFRLPKDLHQRMLKNNLRAWLRKPSAAMVPAICIGCKIIWPSIMNMAKRYHLGCIISGGNPYEYTTFKKELLGVGGNAGLKTTYLLNAIRLAREAAANPSYLRANFLLHTMKGYLFCNQYALGSHLLGLTLDKIDLFHYIPWDEREVLARIQDELDWQAPAGSPSSWRFDCHLSHLKDLMYLITLGVTEKDDFYSKLVREGKMSRQEALERIGPENEVDRKAIEGIFRKLDLNVKNISKWWQHPLHEIARASCR